MSADCVSPQEMRRRAGDALSLVSSSSTLQDRLDMAAAVRNRRPLDLAVHHVTDPLLDIVPLDRPNQGSWMGIDLGMACDYGRFGSGAREPKYIHGSTCSCTCVHGLSTTSLHSVRTRSASG
jgi:hypothetical protein